MAAKVNLKETYGLYINGTFRPASDGGTFDTYNPATGEKLASCAEATKQDVDDAVKAAWGAFPTWKKTEPAERANILLKIADIIDRNAVIFQKLYQFQVSGNMLPMAPNPPRL